MFKGSSQEGDCFLPLLAMCLGVMLCVSVKLLETDVVNKCYINKSELNLNIKFNSIFFILSYKFAIFNCSAVMKGEGRVLA